ncbi:MAG: 4-hydroxybenzoate octaprenyltransferase [Lysobacteraceae bacterium]|nr:MAG: 4-hydroxybenzoate octaprenyltransferase [Xanthomonadaceae bacterium]
MKIPERLDAYLKLMRVDRPIGWLLLLWPTLWALWLAAGDIPEPRLLVIFIGGVLLMRAAGCIANDLADRDLDGYVRRTEGRPLVAGKVTVHEAVMLLAILLTCAFVLVLLTNVLTIQLSFIAVGLAIIYPFMKRVTYLPQVVLGAAFGWAIPMAFAATLNTVPPLAWLIFTATMIWVLIYDTMYAMVDREDDIKIGIRSTAILFGTMDRTLIGLLQLGFVGALGLIGHRAELGTAFGLSIAVVAMLFLWQQRLIADRDPDGCFKAFLNNNYVGLAVFVGIVADVYGRTGA